MTYDSEDDGWPRVKYSWWISTVKSGEYRWVLWWCVKCFTAETSP